MQVQNAAISSTMDKSSTPLNKEMKSGHAEKAGQKMATAEKAAPSPEKMSAENTSAYLKVVSRLENLLKSEEVPEGALKGFTRAIKSRMEQASEKDQKTIVDSPAAKDLGIEKATDLAEKIESGLKDKEQTGKVLALLKHPPFVQLMEGKDTTATATYGPNGKPNTTQGKAVTAPTSGGAEPAAQTKQLGKTESSSSGSPSCASCCINSHSETNYRSSLISTGQCCTVNIFLRFICDLLRKALTQIDFLVLKRRNDEEAI